MTGWRNLGQFGSRLLILSNRQSPVVRSFWSRRGDNAFSDLSTMVQDMESHFRDMERETSRIFDRLYRRTGFPLPWAWNVRNVPVQRAGVDADTFRLAFDVAGVDPQNVKVTVKDRMVTVTARQEAKTSDGGRFVKDYSYQHTLPEGVDPETVRSLLAADGTLTVEAPLVVLESPKEIPVTHENKAEKQK